MQANVTLAQVTLDWDNGQPVKLRQGAVLALPLNEFLDAFVVRLAAQLKAAPVVGVTATAGATGLLDRLRGNLASPVLDHSGAKLDADIEALIRAAAEECLRPLKEKTARADLH